MKYSLLSLNIAAIMLFSTPVHAAVFSDIRSPILREVINYLSENEIIKGYDDETFKPEKSINRAEALKMIMISVGIRTDNELMQNFSDVPLAAWFAPFIASAKKNGLVKGYDDGTFRPDQSIIKAEFIKIAMLAQSWYTEPLNTQDALSQYIDLTSNDWFLPYIAFGLQHNVLDRVKKLYPKKFITRGEAALLLYRLAQLNTTEVLSESEKSAVISCETCIQGVDISKFSWSKSPAVKINNGKLFVGPFDSTSMIADKNFDELEKQIERETRFMMIETAPQSIVTKVDQLFPEYYQRATKIHGGDQAKKGYFNTENEAAGIHFIIKTWKNEKLSACASCDFEEKLLFWYSYGPKTYPPFEAWITTEEAKSFIFDVIHRFSFADIFATLKQR